MTVIKLHRYQVLYDDKQHHEPHSIIVKIVENSQAKLIALPVVWLLSPGTSCTGPSNIIVSPTRGPANIPASDPPTSPEKSLALPAHKSKELPLLGCTVNTDQPHTTCTAE